MAVHGKAKGDSLGMTRVERWIRQTVGRRILLTGYPCLYWTAYLWRRCLRRTRFVLVTGSLGKTTTKELLAGLARTRWRTFASRGTQNARGSLALNILRVRPWHRVAVIEAGTFRPGYLAAAARMVAPHMVVLLSVAHPHWSSFRSLQAVAEEKKSVLRFLRPGGVAVVNGSEPFFGDVQDNDGFRVVRAGGGEGSPLECTEVESWAWPDRLRFRINWQGRPFMVRTRLLGRHWVNPILCALAAAAELGIEPEAAVATCERVKPFPGCLQPLALPSGAVVIRDDYDGSPESFHSALEVLADSRSSRRILVAGDYSDAPAGGPKRRLDRLGREAACICDMVVFVGEHSHRAVAGALKRGMATEMVYGFTGVHAAAAFLRSTLRSGDLVLVKGRIAEHLERIVLEQVGHVRCRAIRCGLKGSCETCFRSGLSNKETGRLVRL